MNNESTIRGYRIQPVVKPDKELQMDYLRLKAEGSHALNELRHSVAKNGANCDGRDEEFSGQELPSDLDAQLMCAGCNSFEKCDIFLKLGHPAYGVFAGKVKGRELIFEEEEV